MTAMLKPRARLCLLVLAVLFTGFGVNRIRNSRPVLADIRNCRCDASNIAAMEEHRECSLCIEAEKQPAYVDVFFLKDKNPTKPNRLLALPRMHEPGGHALAALPAEMRHILWAAAIAKARELWGDDWGIAYNGDERRTQCHTHLHIGKLLPGEENDHFITVDRAADIPAPSEGAGLWVHPVNGKLHVHAGAQVNEFVLMR
jgi:CDP-diacylglycerol pyrophosphatase